MSSFQMAGWTVQPARNRILRGRVERVLQSREMELLVRIAEGRGTVVSKEELLNDVWHGQCVVEHVIPKTVSNLRKALGESARHPRIVHTVPKKGYRLGCAVSAAPVSRRNWRPRLQVAAMLAGCLALPVLSGAPPAPAEAMAIKIKIDIAIDEEYDWSFDYGDLEVSRR
jgi:DNA-binding winged helix-turn-helix (wHTH) protein